MSEISREELADKLDAIFDRIEVSCDWRLSTEERQEIAEAATVIRLAAKDEAEPVAWIVLSEETGNTRIWWRDKARAAEWCEKHNVTATPLYVTPPTAAKDEARERVIRANAIDECIRAMAAVMQMAPETAGGPIFDAVRALSPVAQQAVGCGGPVAWRVGGPNKMYAGMVTADLKVRDVWLEAELEVEARERVITDAMVKSGAAAMCCQAQILGCAAQHKDSEFTTCMLSTFMEDARRCLTAALSSAEAQT